DPEPTEPGQGIDHCECHGGRLQLLGAHESPLRHAPSSCLRPSRRTQWLPQRKRGHGSPPHLRAELRLINKPPYVRFALAVSFTLFGRFVTIHHDSRTSEGSVLDGAEPRGGCREEGLSPARTCPHTPLSVRDRPGPPVVPSAGTSQFGSCCSAPHPPLALLWAQAAQVRRP